MSDTLPVYRHRCPRRFGVNVDHRPKRRYLLEHIVGFPLYSLIVNLQHNLHKKRKRCTATLGRAGLELARPGDLHFRLSWDVVRTIEVQNADEARFRMNAKIHRDASALVVECDQGVTILLEARDCPTLALRAAIGQLLDDTSVVVV